MKQQPLGSFFKLLYPNGQQTGYRFQNFAAGRELKKNKEIYTHAGIGYSGGMTDSTASAVSGTLVMAINELALNIFGTAVKDRWLVEITTTWLALGSLTPLDDFTKDTFELLSIGHEGLRVSVSLGSPIGAAGSELPRLRLTQRMVGNLPPTGNVPF